MGKEKGEEEKEYGQEVNRRWSRFIPKGNSGILFAGNKTRHEKASQLTHDPSIADLRHP